MKGTERQIKWASDIKSKIDAALDAMSNTNMQTELKSFRAWLDSKDSASWWIDAWQLTRTENMFLRMAMRQYKQA